MNVVNLTLLWLRSTSEVCERSPYRPIGLGDPVLRIVAREETHAGTVFLATYPSRGRSVATPLLWLRPLQGSPNTARQLVLWRFVHPLGNRNCFRHPEGQLRHAPATPKGDRNVFLLPAGQPKLASATPKGNSSVPGPPRRVIQACLNQSEE